MSWTLWIYGEATPSGNDILNRMHWTRVERVKKRWALLVHAAVRRYETDNGPIPKAVGRRRVVVTRIARRFLDPANVWLGADKLIVDRLRAWERKRIGGRSIKVPGLGLIVDDSERWLEMTCHQEKGDPAMRIDIEDLQQEGKDDRRGRSSTAGYKEVPAAGKGLRLRRVRVPVSGTGPDAGPV